MKALQYRTIGSAPEVVDIPTPEPGPGQVLLKVTAAGVCHSDEFVMSLPAEAYVYGLPLTLGHEGAGVVAAVGTGVTGIDEGAAYAALRPLGWLLPDGREQRTCENAARLGIMPPGLGSPGAMAEYLLVDSPRHLVPLGDLDPVASVPLTDAGLTPYHAIKPSLPKLLPGTAAVVIGAGGLGHMAIQMLRALTPATVIALDIGEDKLAFAREMGAHHALRSDASATEAVRDLTNGRGAAVVFDFVSAQATADLAATMVHSGVGHRPGRRSGGGAGGLLHAAVRDVSAHPLLGHSLRALRGPRPGSRRAYPRRDGDLLAR
jgi:propanol-preferring alcohol dehydrogenase